MAVHLPLYEASQLEARTMMRPSFNVLSPSNGEVILKPTQDMVIGCYYLTLMINNNKSILKNGSQMKRSFISFYQKNYNTHSILVRYSLSNFKIKTENGKMKLMDLKSNLNINEREIFIHKILSGKSSEKYYLVTSIGILIAHYLNENYYQLTDLFFRDNAWINFQC
jgi:DNA-directed RNA polymerase beta' subunit